MQRTVDSVRGVVVGGVRYVAIVDVVDTLRVSSERFAVHGDPDSSAVVRLVADSLSEALDPTPIPV